MQKPFFIPSARKSLFYASASILLFVLMIVAVFILTSATIEKPLTQRPNMIFIMADDMGYSDIGCYGSEIKTPNIDKLATNGIRVKNFYNNARCCPTRASLLTGQYPHTVGKGQMVTMPTAKIKPGSY